MKLKTKTIYITDSKGEEIDVEGLPIILVLNGQKTETKLTDVLGYTEFDEGEIYTNSLLSYYKPQEDGSIAVEGSSIQLMNADTGEFILVKKIVRPDINDDTDISFELVKLFAETFNVIKPEEVFTHLNDEEKQVFIAEREQKEAGTKKEKLEAEQKLADAETERLAKEKEDTIKAEKELKKSIDENYVCEKKEFTSEEAFYRGIDFKQYVNHPYHLFYGNDNENEPKVFIKRGIVGEPWYQEVEDVFVAAQNDETATIEFSDGDKPKQMVLDIATGEITISDSKGSE